MKLQAIYGIQPMECLCYFSTCSLRTKKRGVSYILGNTKSISDMKFLSTNSDSLFPMLSNFLSSDEHICLCDLISPILALSSSVAGNV